ncbi:hypothetical protein AHAS_Ahas01G0159800 [Arachis hypogaea]
MTDADKAQVDSMHRHGLPPSKIMGLIAGQAGGYEFAGFTKKDLDNYIERNLHSKIIEGDVNATLNYLHENAEDEPMMIEQTIIAKTCIFGFSLLADKQTKSYKLLDNFSEAMMNKHPGLVIMDGDNAMKSEIEEVFLNATHRLCAWHLYKNAVSHIKDLEFLASSRMVYLEGRKLSHFRYTMNEICRVTKDLEAKLEQTISLEKGKKVGDPTIAKSKDRTVEKDVQHNDIMVSEDEFEDGVESVSISNDQELYYYGHCLCECSSSTFFGGDSNHTLQAMKLLYMAPFPVIDGCYR